MKKFLLALSILAIGILPNMAQQEAFPAGVVESAFQKAKIACEWNEAREVQIPETQWWPYEEVLKPYVNKYGFLESASRVLGVYLTEEGNRRLSKSDRVYLMVYEKVVIFVKMEEHISCPGFLEEVLIHEYLHFFYTRLAILDPHFPKEHPDEHKWMKEIYNFKNVCWGK